MRSTSIILSVFGLALILILSVGAYRASEANESATLPVIEPAVVRCGPLEAKTYTMTELFYGFVEANVEVDLGFQIAGKVIQLGATREGTLKENDRVTKGQILARLDPERYDAAVKEAEAGMEGAKAGMMAAQAVVDDAQARLDDAERNLRSIQGLYDDGAANEQALENAKVRVRTDKARLDNAQAQLASASAGYMQRQAAATVARVNLADSILKSPIDGVVARVPAQVGQVVTPAQTVMTLVDTSKVKLVVGVVERRIPLLEQGQNVRVEVGALAAGQMGSQAQQATIREGTVTMVPPTSDTRTGHFHVEIELPNEDGALRPGMIGGARVVVKETTAVAIPAQAVLHEAEGLAAFFVSDGYHVGLDLGGVGRAAVKVPSAVARKILIEPVAVDNGVYLIDELPEGVDKLVVEGQSRLIDGQAVYVLDEQTALPSQTAHAR